MILCKKCGSKDIVKSGKIREKQRYLCKKCGYHFVEGDERSETAAGIKTLCVLLSALSKGDYQAIGRVFNRDRSQIYRWEQKSGIQKTTVNSRSAELYHCDNLKGIERYFRNRNDIFSPRKPFYAANGIIDGDYSVVVIVQRKKDKK